LKITKFFEPLLLVFSEGGGAAVIDTSSAVQLASSFSLERRERTNQRKGSMPGVATHGGALGQADGKVPQN
jgi:hypothetical protein